MSRLSTARRADLMLLVATLIWGGSFAVVKQALVSSTPLAFTAARFALAAVLLTPFAGVGRPFTRGEIGAGALLGGLLAVGFAAQAVGLDSTTASRSAFIVSTSSVLAPVVAFVWMRERPRPTVIAALALAGFGMYLLTAPDAGGLNRGDLWTLGTAATFGVQIAAVALLARRYDPVRLVWMEILATALGSAVAAALFEDARLTWGAALAGALGYSAVLASVVALLWQTHAQRHMSAARAALVFCLEPVFATAIAWLWLGERLAVSQWVGGAMILAGMLVAEAPGRPAAGEARLLR